MRNWTKTALWVLGCMLQLGSACTLPTASLEPRTPINVERHGRSSLSQRSGNSVIQTVFIILMENHDWSQIIGSSNAPFINDTLLPQASYTDQYYNPPGLHPSLPNYLWLEAGTNFGITSDLLPSSAHQNTTNHLISLLNRAGISWRSYQEDICGCNCPLSNTNLYVPRHEP